MNITVSGHHVEVTPALRRYVLTKLERITRHFDHLVDISVLLSIERHADKDSCHRAEATIHVKGRKLFAQQKTHDLYASIDEMVDKLDRQVIRHKDRLQEHRPEGSRRVVSWSFDLVRVQLWIEP